MTLASTASALALSHSADEVAGGVLCRLIKLRLVKNQTTNGKVLRFSALVVAGNGNGGLGFAQAKCSTASDAIHKASKKATKTMEYYYRWQDRTIFHDDWVKFKATKLLVRPAPFGKTKFNLIIFYLIRVWKTLSSGHLRNLQMYGCK